MRILIVEDDVQMAELYANELSAYSDEVTISKDGFSALKKLQQNCPNMVILDNKIPNIKGIDLAKWISNKYNPYIVMITGDCEFYELRNQELDKYVDKIVQKPFDTKYLRDYVKCAKNRDYLLPRFESKEKLCKEEIKKVIEGSVSVITPSLSDKEYDFLVEAVLINSDSNRNESLYLKLMNKYQVHSFLSVYRKMTKIRKKINQSLSNNDLVNELTMEYLKYCK